jgi:Bacterial PH domain
MVHMPSPASADVATTYRSAVDRWLLLVLGGALLVAGVSCGIVLVSGDAAARAIAGATGALGVGLPLWVLTSTSYTLTSEHLVVRSGPFRWRIPIAGIVEVTPTRNPLSAPALSLNRLRIMSAGASVMISPADPGRFLADLEARRARAAAAR